MTWNWRSKKGAKPLRRTPLKRKSALKGTSAVRGSKRPPARADMPSQELPAHPKPSQCCGTTKPEKAQFGKRKARVTRKRSKPRNWKRRVRLTGGAVGILREQCFERAKGRCERCGIAITLERFEMAHLRGRGASGEDVLDNVWASCGSRTGRPGCHKLSHDYGPSFQKPVPKKTGRVA